MTKLWNQGGKYGRLHCLRPLRKLKNKPLTKDSSPRLAIWKRIRCTTLLLIIKDLWKKIYIYISTNTLNHVLQSIYLCNTYMFTCNLLSPNHGMHFDHSTILEIPPTRIRQYLYYHWWYGTCLLWFQQVDQNSACTGDPPQFQTFQIDSLPNHKVENSQII